MQWQSPNDASMHRPLIAAHHVRPIPENLHSSTTGASVATPSSSAASQRSAGWSSFPGRRSSTRPAAPPMPDSNDNKYFIGTGGNALQAISRQEAQDQGLLAVTVPMGTVSGQKIMVSVPDGSGRLIEAIVPPGIFEGHTFLVRIPPLTMHEQEAAAVLESQGTRPSSWVPPHAGYMVPYQGGDIPTASATVAPSPPPVPGHDVVSVPMAQVWGQPQSNASAPYAGGSAPLPTATPFSQALDNPAPTARNPREANVNSNVESDLVLVRVPVGVLPGSAIRVQVDDGRLIEAIVPNDPTVTEFYVRVPPPPPTTSTAPSSSSSTAQNWHNHPFAIAPMVLGPFLT